MSDDKYHQNLIVGAAVVAGILGTLSALARSQRSDTWADKARNATHRVLESGEAVNKNMLLGGVAGGLIGAATALLLAPKAGGELIKDLTHPFAGEEPHVRSSSRKSATHKGEKKKKEASHSKKVKSSRRKTAENEEKEKSLKGAGKKKTAARRRTASAALKSSAVSEKIESAISEA